MECKLASRLDPAPLPDDLQRDLERDGAAAQRQRPRDDKPPSFAWPRTDVEAKRISG